jgi:hypothetical protein
MSLIILKVCVSYILLILQKRRRLQNFLRQFHQNGYRLMRDLLLLNQRLLLHLLQHYLQ